VYIKTHPNVL